MVGYLTKRNDVYIGNNNPKIQAFMDTLNDVWIGKIELPKTEEEILKSRYNTRFR